MRQFIEYFDNAGASINQTQFAIAANSILEEAHTNPAIPPPKIGEHWVERFLKRNPQYYLQRVYCKWKNQINCGIFRLRKSSRERKERPGNFSHFDST